MDYQVNGKIMGRNGNRLSTAAPHGVFKCQGDDRWIAISVMDEQQWPQFCQAIGNPGLARQNEYSNLSQRKKNEDALDKIVTAWTMAHTARGRERCRRRHTLQPVEKPSISPDPVRASPLFYGAQHAVMGSQNTMLRAAFSL
jgi:crotonobetainyl-CoA:carnitine CoA-transferase CaiB-like acyl-CoA transferase